MAEQEKGPQNGQETEPEAPKFDKRWLKGLTFSASKAEKVKTEAGVRTRHVPFTRPLGEGDVMAVAIRGGEVVLAAKDGRKHRVKL